ncbi:putative RNA polymerase I specific transcription initiation factor Rrn7 [Rosellinia necatrix]|uniref:Putative RNA polymerase I specific transcription initiation factor Rrn7 n=1 Tax=Rosellinia necatrix TaxID=77044 RepID=A0A1S8A4T2_ROSNE|nr:putative RNA polymerase I specific transcription initiation factor Rrn7 [Rosellinia necatrix]
MDNPETFLASLVLVSTKLAYSLDNVERPPINQHDPRRMQVDWKAWQRITTEKPTGQSANLRRGEEYKVTADDALTLDKTKLDDYMDWFEKMWLHEGEPKTTERVRNLFGQTRGSSIPEEPQTLEQNHEDQLKKRYKRLARSVRPVSQAMESSEDEKSQPRNLCPIWRSEADLPDAAKVLYNKMAELTAIPLTGLIRGAKQVERQLELWCIRKTKEDGKGKGKGKGKSKGKEWAAEVEVEVGDDTSEDYL